MHDLVWRKAIQRELSAVFADSVTWKDGGLNRVIFRRYVRPENVGESEAAFLAEMLEAVSRINIDGERFTAIDRGTVDWKGTPAYFVTFSVVRK